MKNSILRMSAIAALICALAAPVHAQTAATAAQAPGSAPSLSAEPALPGPVKSEDLPDLPASSLFFSPQQMAAIHQALVGIYMPLFEQEQSITGAAAVPLAARTLHLSGMLYSSDKNWIIWLNGFRLTPNRLLPEVVEINVGKKEVSLKWYDAVLNKIIAITLRPHQIYDIDTGILLPG